jgi:predicted TPR repeat methyltransferase
MLAKAKEKGIYDELLKEELTHYLRKHHYSFDVIVSADTLVYFGPLDEVALAARRALRQGGVLIFTVEELSGDPTLDFRLETHGRYSHSQHYVERVLRHQRFDVDISHAQLRTESLQPVAGLVVRATKQHGRDHADHD